MIGDADGSGRAGPARGGDLVVRIVSAVVMAALALLGAVLGGWAAAFVVAIVTAIVHLEWANLTERSPWPTAAFTAGLVVALAMITLGRTEGGITIIGLALLASALTLNIWRPLGLAYAAVLGAGLLLIRLSPDGLVAVLLVLAVVWVTDTGAYVAGKLFGGAKLWPAVSPGKTWAGAIGGLLAGVIGGLLVAGLLGIGFVPVLVLVVAGLSISAQVGDLFESWVKRQFGAKDSGKLIPGHGGLMDRVDGLVFATGFALLIGWLHAGQDLARGLVTW